MLKTPIKYPRTFHWPTSECVHSDDKRCSTPEFFINKNIIITEKLDGSNTCLYNGEVFSRSVSAPTNNQWLKMSKKHHAYKTFDNDLMFYGEDIYGVHSIEYDPLKEDKTFNLFAIRKVDKNIDIFLSWSDVKKTAKELNIPTVPIIYEGQFNSINKLTKFLKNELKEKSQFGNIKEGFVIRNSEQFDSNKFANNVCKYVRANHVQTKLHWRVNWKPIILKK